jgi:sulfate adenylyltransferase
VNTSIAGRFPAVQLDDAAGGDLQLLLQGVELPWTVLGARVGDTGVAPVPAATDARPPVRQGVHVRLSTDQATLAVSCGAVDLTDREQTPLARLLDPVPDPTRGDRSVVSGHLQALRAREAMLFGDRMRRPDQLAVHRGERVVVVAGRPPLRGELADLVSGADDVLLLVPTETPTPDGLPPVVLMRTMEAAMGDEGLQATCLPVALVWRDAASDEALAASVARAYGADRTVYLASDPRWRAVIERLRRDEPVQDAVTSGVADELRRWHRPARSRGLVVLFTGLSGSGKSTLARDLTEHIVMNTRRSVSLLDGDDVRRLLSSGLGFDRTSRDLNVRRIGYVASEIARHGGIAVCAPIAPYAGSREAVRRMVAPVGDLVLVHVSTPIEECERRDLKGLYARARSGQTIELTGVNDPYDVPDDADLIVDTSAAERPKAVHAVIEHLERGGWLTTTEEDEGEGP